MCVVETMYCSIYLRCLIPVKTDCTTMGRYKIRNGTERRNGMNKTISCIRKVIKFVEYIRFQLRRLPKQFINMHNVYLAE